MGRLLSLDETTILERATMLFWERGYAATSMRDLERNVGVDERDLQQTFGDKRTLFLRCLSQYVETHLAFRGGVLNRVDAGLAEIQSFLAALIDFATPIGNRNGCLVVNTIAETDDVGTDARTFCWDDRETLTKAISAAFANAAKAGEVRRDIVPDIAADCLVAQVYGVLLMAKSGVPRERLSAIANQALRAVS